MLAGELKKNLEKVPDDWELFWYGDSIRTEIRAEEHPRPVPVGNLVRPIQCKTLMRWGATSRGGGIVHA